MIWLKLIKEVVASPDRVRHNKPLNKNFMERKMDEFKITKTQALTLLASTTFRDFTKNDWACFAGCESENPRIGENGPYMVVIDGDIINILHNDDIYGGQLFTLTEN
jgi:hypothetical protein